MSSHKPAAPALSEQIEGFAGADAQRRMDIVERIGEAKSRDPDALRVLGQAARDPDPLLSWYACRALADLGPAAAAAAPDMAAVLREADAVRIPALQTIRRMGEAAVRTALPDAASCLASADPLVRFEALLTIAAAGRGGDVAVRGKVLDAYRAWDQTKAAPDCNLLAAYLKALAVFPTTKEAALVYGRALTGFPMPMALTSDEAKTIQRNETRRITSYFEKSLQLGDKNNSDYRSMAAKTLQELGPDAAEAVPDAARALEDLFVEVGASAGQVVVLR